VRDELAWELVRDEWELLLAIGSGPTSVDAAAKAVEAPLAQVQKRVGLLAQHGLVAKSDLGFSLVPAFYERREGMSSYVRDLVLRRLQDEAAPPLAGKARLDLGSAEALATIIGRAEAELFPAVVELANRPESDQSRRFSVFFAAAELATPGEDESFKTRLLDVLKAAATAKSLDPESKSAYLWVAEMRVDPEVAVEVGELMERHLDAVSHSRTGSGAAVFAVLPASRNHK